MSKLVVAGCSHTEGCAFWVNKHTTDKDVTPLSSPELQKFYKQKTVSKQWVRDNITWGAKLQHLGKYKSFLNLGRGGQGIDYILRKILFYIQEKDNLTDHTFIIQIPAPERKEFFYNQKLHTFTNLVNHDEIATENKSFLFELYNLEYYEYQTLQTALVIQVLLESKNAKVKFFCEPFLDLQANNPKSIEHLHKILIKDTLIIRYERLLDKINFIPTKNFRAHKELYLHHAGLKVNDMHFTEKGNSKLATYLYENMEYKENYRSLL
jgi:hypothetical protein|tara:strand:- start:686 stop:1483 length:798 start_codon:yes stop_codon:yes gene_type:complete